MLVGIGGSSAKCGGRGGVAARVYPVPRRNRATAGLPHRVRSAIAVSIRAGSESCDHRAKTMTAWHTESCLVRRPPPAHSAVDRTPGEPTRPFDMPTRVGVQWSREFGQDGGLVR